MLEYVTYRDTPGKTVKKMALHGAAVLVTFEDGTYTQFHAANDYDGHPEVDNEHLNSWNWPQRVLVESGYYTPSDVVEIHRKAKEKLLENQRKATEADIDKMNLLAERYGYVLTLKSTD